MITKSVIAGEYTAPPAHGPMTSEICGTTPGGQRVAQEDVGVAAEAGDAFLDARAAGVGESDDRRAVLNRQVHHLADLLGVRLGQRAAEDGEVLAVDEYPPAVDATEAGDDAVAQVPLLVEAELARPMRHERVELREAVLVEQQIQPLAGRQLAARVLLLHSLGSPAEKRGLTHRAQPLQLVGGRHAALLRVRGWWARQESNLRPSGYEPVALTIELRARSLGGGQVGV